MGETKWKQKFENVQKNASKYEEQIKELKSKIQSNEVGRDYESQLWKEKLNDISQKDMKIKELKLLVENLQCQIDGMNKRESSDGTNVSVNIIKSLENRLKDCEVKEQQLLMEIENL